MAGWFPGASTRESNWSSVFYFVFSRVTHEYQDFNERDTNYRDEDKKTLHLRVKIQLKSLMQIYINAKRFYSYIYS